MWIECFQDSVIFSQSVIGIPYKVFRILFSIVSASANAMSASSRWSEDRRRLTSSLLRMYSSTCPSLLLTRKNESVVSLSYRPTSELMYCDGTGRRILDGRWLSLHIASEAASRTIHPVQTSDLPVIDQTGLSTASLG